MKTKTKFLISLMAFLLIGASVASAQPDKENDPEFDNNVDMVGPTQPLPPKPVQKQQQQQQQTVTQELNYTPEHSIRDQVIGITPEIGMISYTNQSGTYTTRATAGAGFDLNFLAQRPDSEIQNWYGGNFFGSNSAGAPTNNSNLVIIPADVKVGYNFNSVFRFSAHGGGNVIYRSVADSIDLGSGSNGTDSAWKIYPNVGVDAEWQVSQSFSVLIRPDITLTQGNNLLNTTVGATWILF